MKKIINILIIFMSIVSVGLIFFDLEKISIYISLISIVGVILFCRNSKRIFFFVLCISFSCVITNLLYIYNNDIYKEDIYININILNGSWSKINSLELYSFYDNYTYKRLSDSKKDNYYCVGNYKYSYGGSSDSGEVIKYDNNYLYYDLLLDNEYCINNEIKEENYSKKRFIIGVKKNSTKIDELMIIDTDTKEVSILKKYPLD